MNLWVWVAAAVLLFSSQEVRRTDDAGDVSKNEKDDGFERVKPTCGLQTTSDKRRDEEGARARGREAHIMTHRTIRGIDLMDHHSILASEGKYIRPDAIEDRSQSSHHFPFPAAVAQKMAHSANDTRGGSPQRCDVQ